MKKVIKKVAQVLQILLMAPVKLPGKALSIIKYVALGIGILDQVMEEEEDVAEEEVNN